MKRTASERINELSYRLERIASRASASSHPFDDNHALSIAKSLGNLLHKMGLSADFVAESGHKIGFLIDNSLGNAMGKLKKRTLGITWLNSDSFSYMGSKWTVYLWDGDIYCELSY